MATDPAYEKLATRARELLSAVPRPPNDDVADRMLGEIADEFEVSGREEFIARLLPAMRHIVGAARAHIIRPLEEAAARPHLLKSATPAPVGQSETRPIAIPPTPTGAGVERGDHTRREFQSTSVTPSAPQADGRGRFEAQTSGAVPAERGDEAAMRTPQPKVPSLPVTPLSLRAEVIDGWRALRDETLYVPEHGDVTYGEATIEQIDRAITYQHSRARASVDKARRLRALRDFITSAGGDRLSDVLDGRVP